MITAFLVLIAVAFLLRPPPRVIVYRASWQQPEGWVHPMRQLPLAPRPLVRRRPLMRWRAHLRQYECQCGGVETDQHVALGKEHDCLLEVWS